MNLQQRVTGTLLHFYSLQVPGLFSMAADWFLKKYGKIVSA